MGDSKVFMFPDYASGNSSLDPNTLFLLGQNGSFGGNGNGLYLHCESGYTSVHFYQISPDCAIKMDVFHNTQIIPQ